MGCHRRSSDPSPSQQRMSLTGAAKYRERDPNETRVARSTAVKNKTPATRQITVEQILREANECQIEEVAPPTKRKIVDQEELDEYRLVKRKEFEDAIRRTRTAMQYYTKYAMWEESQRDFRRARSVFERAIAVDHRNLSLWIKFEMRYNELDRARGIFERFVTCHPESRSWLKYAKWEGRQGSREKTRNVYERALEALGDQALNETFFTAFASFEERTNEAERARALYKYALDNIPRDKAQELYKNYVSFERQLCS